MNNKPKFNLQTPQEEQAKNYKLKAILTSRKPEVKQIKTGLHKNKLYFAFNVFDEETMKTAILTSDKEVYIKHDDKRDEIKREFGLYYDFDFQEAILDTKLKTEWVHEYLYENPQIKSVKQLYEDILTLNKKYMYYPDDNTHKIIALDIISTFFMPCFHSKGRIFLEAEAGSGKTRQCTIYKKLSFNTLMSADISKSAFFRMVESTVGTLIIDDFDSINEEQKIDILQNYKTGYKNDSKTVRVGDDKKRTIEYFRTYSHVIMNNTQGLDNISSERSIFLNLLKTNKKLTNTNPENDPSFQFILKQLYFTALDNWFDVKNIADNIKSDVLNGRKFEISKSIISLAEYIDSQLKSEIEVWLENNLEQNKFVDFETDWDYIIYKEIYLLQEGDSVSAKKIAEKILETLSISEYNKKTELLKKTQYVGRKLCKSPLVKKVLINSKTHFKLLNKAKMTEYFHMKWGLGYGFGGVTPAEGFSEVPDQTQLNSTQPNHTPPYPTIPNPNTTTTTTIYTYLTSRINEEGNTTVDRIKYWLKNDYGQEFTNEKLQELLTKMVRTGVIYEVKPDVYRTQEIL